MSRRAPGCMFHRIMSQGDTADKEAVIALLNSKTTNIDIARTMTEIGHPMSEHTVRSHRKADCTCSLVAA